MDVKLLLLINCVIVVNCQSTISNSDDAKHECELSVDIKSEIGSIHQLMVNLHQETKSDIEEIRQIVIQQQNQPRNGNLKKNCPPGFDYLPETGSCYRVIFELMTWDNATERCRQVMPGVHLAAITSKDENDAIVRYLRPKFSGGNNNSYCRPPRTRWPHLGDLIWIGGQTKTPRRCGDPYDWKPLRGIDIPFNYANWRYNSPDCYESLELCAHIVTGINYQWNDFNCGLLSCAICELHV